MGELADSDASPSVGGVTTCTSDESTRRWPLGVEPLEPFVVAGAVAVAAFTGRSLPTTVALVVAAVVIRRRWSQAVLVIVVVAMVWRADQAIDDVRPDELGVFRGWATVADDPQQRGGAVRVILTIDGERFECWQRGRVRQQRAAGWNAGDRVWVSGERVQLDDQRWRRVRWQHVVGGFEADALGDRLPGTRVAVANNRVRALIATATSTLDPAIGALARGLIIGDDRDQPPAMVERFRSTGLAHLVAVSGQNVAFLVAAAGPLLSRLRPTTRLLATLGVIAWFVTLTRAEPSILRAGVMAGLAAIAFATGRERDPTRLLAGAVVGLLLIDPLLVESVGFWLSVGATAGVTVLTRPIAVLLARTRRLALPLAVTIAAQLGVAIPSLAVFGRLPVISVVANLFAVPVAGAVMLYGLPAALVAGAVAPLRPLLMLPVDVGTRWVDRVSVVADRVQPSGRFDIVAWIAICAVLVVLAGRRTVLRQWRPDGDPLSHR